MPPFSTANTEPPERDMIDFFPCPLSKPPGNPGDAGRRQSSRQRDPCQLRLTAKGPSVLAGCTYPRRRGLCLSTTGLSLAVSPANERARHRQPLSICAVQRCASCSELRCGCVLRRWLGKGGRAESGVFVVACNSKWMELAGLGDSSPRYIVVMARDHRHST